MANAIQRLRAENETLQAEVDTLRRGLRELLAHLQIPKFHGPENAWIATNDVALRIHQIEAEATLAQSGT